MSAKPTVYVDANILSILFYRGPDERTIARRLTTRDWWAVERPLFQVWGSPFLVTELSGGQYAGREKAVPAATRLPYLAFTESVNRSRELLLDEGIVPFNKAGDALHLAFATVYKVDYLLTWNRAHLSNVTTQEKLNVLCKREGWRPPLVVSPDTIPKAALGQEIRRHHEGTRP